MPFALTSLSLVSSLACSPCSLSFARNARPFFLFVFDPLHFDTSPSFPCSYARPARSHSLAKLAPSYLSLAPPHRPLRRCSPCSFSFARTARPCPSMCFSFFILNTAFLSYKFYPLLIDRSRSYPRSIPLAHSLARMLAWLAPSYLSLALARRPLRQCSPCSLSYLPLLSHVSLHLKFSIANRLHLDSSRSYPRSQARPARSRSLAPLAPSYLSLTLARLLARSPLRHLPPLAHCRFCNTVLARIRFGSHNTVLARIRFSSYNTVLTWIRFRS